MLPRKKNLHKTPGLNCSYLTLKSPILDITQMGNTLLVSDSAIKKISAMWVMITVAKLLFRDPKAAFVENTDPSLGFPWVTGMG
jgi:hypothetical protein